MKRIIRISLCLVLGVVTTVAVAWAMARWSVSTERITEDMWPYPPTEIASDEYIALAKYGVRPNEGRKFAKSSVEGWGYRRETYWEITGPLFDPAQRGGGMSGGFSWVAATHVSGWPCRALRCDERVDRASERQSGLTYRERYQLFGGFDVIDHLPEPTPGFEPWPIERPIPVRPILPGFIVNTLFYAAIWFGVLFVPGIAKRAIRRKRGRCVKCGYDLRGDVAAGCPECGWNR